MANMDRLVLSCTDILQREQQAWRSVSQAIPPVQLLRERTKAQAAGQGSGVAMKYTRLITHRCAPWQEPSQEQAASH